MTEVTVSNDGQIFNRKGACPYNVRYCVSPGTRILTSTLHWVYAEELKIGDKLMGFDEFGPRRRWKEAIIEGYEIIKKRCFDLEFEDGTKITSG